MAESEVADITKSLPRKGFTAPRPLLYAVLDSVLDTVLCAALGAGTYFRRNRLSVRSRTEISLVNLSGPMPNHGAVGSIVCWATVCNSV